MEKALFTIDGFDHNYAGYTNGQTWNGWQMPYLPKSEVLRLLENECFGDYVRFEWDGNALYEIDEEGRFQVNADVINGEIVYQIGNGWVWERVKIYGNVCFKNIHYIDRSESIPAIEYAIRYPEKTDVIEWLIGFPEFGETMQSGDIIYVSL